MPGTVHRNRAYCCYIPIQAGRDLHVHSRIFRFP